MIDSKKPCQISKQERDAMSITEIAKLVDEYCQQNGVSFEVALYAIHVALSDAENP